MQQEHSPSAESPETGVEEAPAPREDRRSAPAAPEDAVHYLDEEAASAGPEPEETPEEILGLAEEPAAEKSAQGGEPAVGVQESSAGAGWLWGRRNASIVGLALLLLLGLVGGVSLWRTRGEVSALRSDLQAIKEGARRAEILQARAAIGRAGAELEPLLESLPPGLSADVEKAQAILRGVSDSLKASR
jgi:hypothetical protein